MPGTRPPGLKFPPKTWTRYNTSTAFPPSRSKNFRQFLVGRTHTPLRNQPQVRVHAQQQVQLEQRARMLHAQQDDAACLPLVLRRSNRKDISSMPLPVPPVLPRARA
jgi:hypothetical protein